MIIVMKCLLIVVFRSFRVRSIAIVKTLGLSENSIIKSFFLTGFTIGFLATITGVFLGVIFSIYILMKLEIFYQCYLE